MFDFFLYEPERLELWEQIKVVLCYNVLLFGFIFFWFYVTTNFQDIVDAIQTFR